MTPMLPAIRILTSSSSKGRIGFQSNIIGQIILSIGKLRQKFRRDNHIVGTRNNLDVFYFEVERKLLISFTNNNSLLIRSIVLLIVNHQFDNTCFTNSREVRQLINLCCLDQFLQRRTIKLETNILSGESNFFLRRRNNHSCLLYTSPSPRDGLLSRMPSSA